MKEEIKKLKETYRRFMQGDFELERSAEGQLTSMTFSASSETPYERWFGTEILSHDTSAIRMERANGGAMPMLFNHDVGDILGMVEKAWISNHRMMVKTKPFSTDRMAEVQKMIDGGLRNVSIAYRINKIEENTKTPDEFRVTDWEPFEVSIVTVPADPSVGIGREYEMRMYRNESTMPEANGADGLTRRAAMDPKDGNGAATVPAPAGAVTVIEADGKPELSPMQYEERRVQAIKNLCKGYRLDERHEAMFIGQGQSIETISKQMLDIVEKRGAQNPQSIAKLGLGDREKERYSLNRAIYACAIQNWSNAPFELECSLEVAKRTQKVPDPQKFYVPYEVMERPVGFLPRNQRDLVVATTTAGGFLVDTQNMGFIDLLRARSVAFRMGARRLSGLVGNVTIARLSAAGTMYWLATEATAITESQQTFEQVSLSPNTAGAYTEISRQLLLQSNPGAEQIVTNDLSTIVALGVDLAVLAGTGGAQPQGIIGTSGVGSVTGTTIAYGGVLEFQTDVANAQVQPVSGGYVTTPTLAGTLMTRVKFASTASPLWEGNVWEGTMAGFPAMSSTQVPTGDIIFGDWSEVVVAEWGVLEVEVNPYANFQAGIIGVRCMYSMDSAVKRPAAFSIATSVT